MSTELDLAAPRIIANLLAQISDTYTQGRTRAVQAVNTHMTETYWQVGRHIVEFEQGGKNKAEYGKALISNLSRDLGLRHGRGFSPATWSTCASFINVFRMRKKVRRLSDRLSWSHIVELLKLDDPLERGFYESSRYAERWSVRELMRQKPTVHCSCVLPPARTEAGILQLAAQGQIVEQPADLLREPYVFEFLKIPEPYQVSETQLETVLCDHLQPFLLELGKGFTFVGRQYRVTINNTHYKVDLVFYHRILRCFVLIDLKLGDVQHHDIGQMNHLSRLLRQRRKCRRRQPAHRHHPQPQQGRTARRIRHLRHEQHSCSCRNTSFTSPTAKRCVANWN
jgi:predicted nuclease of restriction endonuclease-like (RecB) superfamily